MLQRAVYAGRGGDLFSEMATHSSILIWRIPQTEEPGGLQSTGSQRADSLRSQLSDEHSSIYHVTEI